MDKTTPLYQKIHSFPRLKCIFAVFVMAMCGICLILISMPTVLPVLNLRKQFYMKVLYETAASSWLREDGLKPQRDNTSLLKSGQISILWYNKPNWMGKIDDLNRQLNTVCPNIECSFTVNKKNLSQHSAVLFSIQDRLDPNDPQLLKTARNPYQPWIFFHAESPVHIGQSWYKSKQWHNTMNWSMTYRSDSDVYSPFSERVPRNVIVKKNYSEIFRKKDKFAAWIVSHCSTQSKRKIYVQRLRKLGIPVDIYGACSGQSVSRDISHVNHLLESRYKFYLSFENSICKDYITEKFYSHYDIDTIMVVRGGADYNKMFPNGTYINTGDFQTIKDLAQFLLRLNSSESLYTAYLKSRNTSPFSYRQRSEQKLLNHCYVCEKVRNAHLYTKQYDDITPYVSRKACRDPTDIK